MEQERPSWRDGLAFGLPEDFNYPHVRSADDAVSFILTLQNADRGTAALRLYEHRAVIGRAAAYAGMMAAWKHDHGCVLDAFDDTFASALAEVAEPIRRKKRPRIWRGVIVEAETPKSPWEMLGISWTRDRDLACWFALRFNRPGRRPFVFEVLVDPHAVVTVWNGRSEREVIVDPETFAFYPVQLEGSQIDVSDLDEHSRAPDEAIDRWRLAADRHNRRRHESDQRRWRKVRESRDAAGY